MLPACIRGDVEVCSSGGTLQACRRGDVEAWRCAALETCCIRRDAEEFAPRDLEMCCRRVDVELPEGMRRVLLCISRYLAFVPQDSFQSARGQLASRNAQFTTCSRVRKLNSYATLAISLSLTKLTRVKTMASIEDSLDTQKLLRIQNEVFGDVSCRSPSRHILAHLRH